MEHDLLNESPANKKQNRSGISATITVTKNGAAARAASPDHFDLEEVIDEFGDDGIEAGGGDLEKSQSRGAGGQLLNEDSNSFDLDNSDDLNRFIQKYETMLDGEAANGVNNKSAQKLAGIPAKATNSVPAAKGKEMKRGESKDLEDSWGSLQFQAEQMLGGATSSEDASDKTLNKKKSSTNTSVMTSSAAVQARIVEDEIIAEEIRLAQQRSGKKTVGFGNRRRSSDANADIIEDFENDFEDETEIKKTEEDAIVDEVEEEDALRMIDEEIMNTTVGKTDAKKLKELISKIDGGPRPDHFTEPRATDNVFSQSFSNKNKSVD